MRAVAVKELVRLLLIVLNVSGPMNNGQNVDLVRLDVIDDPVWAFDHLPDLFQPVFGNDSAGLGK
ncbi:MAG: hypothetical protein WCG34_08375 [Leptolinea sp.]